MSKRRPRNPFNADLDMVNRLDKLAAFEEFEADILPQLRKAIKGGASADDILKLAQSVAAARLVTVAVKEADSGKALAAVKDILDRTQGKAVERKEIEHKYAKLKEEELDSLILSELSTDEADDTEAH